MTAWRLLLTRPAAESAQLAATLAAQGVFSYSLPLLQIEALADSAEQRALILDLDRYCAVIVVSKPAARLGLALLDRYWSQPPLTPSWFAVGAASAQILQEHGLSAKYPAQGDASEALLAMPELSVALTVHSPRVLIMRGEGGREFIAERLRGQGVTVDYLQLYRRSLPAYPPTLLIEQLTAQRLNGISVSSGEGFAHLLQLAGAAWSQVARLPLFVPSARVAEQARAAGAEIVLDCRGASATALLAALRAQPAPAP
ncbi:MAG: uroporphyrinogen-III synthase [Pseudomonas sp.]|uniref:uroporphyrinogen-III synthase n=1 Tax=Pseudomonas sp. TaxID=306 RepID=UPI00273350D6|nr:uroporphyrinogen-III synthase [Pseudomonas sp.]MDP3848571.1 uroporphyrinogen-III synthase [Pseudomonas sp.]